MRPRTIELKYTKKDAPATEIEALRQEAIKQIEKYSQDRLLIAACEGTELHRLIIVYAGWEMKACEVCVSDADCMVAAKTVKNS